MVLPILGCAHKYPSPVEPDDPRYAPVVQNIEAIPKAAGGSAYVDGNGGLSLYQDMKAHRVGDIITVKLEEETKASKDAKTGYNKTSALNTSLGLKPPSNPSKNPLVGNINNGSNFKGEGDSKQNNSLTGDITVTISQVLPNNNLIIRGEKWLTLNQGSEYIRLTGIVRPQDIGPDNTVVSTRIANARITYSGTGAVSDANKSGWLSRFFNSEVWPF